MDLNSTAITVINLWRPLLSYRYSYTALCARLG